MKRSGWLVAFGASLIALSVIIYVVQIELFHTPHNTVFYLFQDLAFVPVQVLLVTLIVHRLLGDKEKRARMDKLNMVIGAFFSEAGTELLKTFSVYSANYDKFRESLLVTNKWTGKHFSSAGKYLRNYNYGVGSQKGNLEELKSFLTSKRDFLLRLLENPNLLEHETFTDLLFAVFHLTEELVSRADVENLSTPDAEHIAADMSRAYGLLILQWLAYMRHLKESYPYLFSLAVRINPFDPDASPEVG